MKNSFIKEDNILVVDGTNLIHRNYYVHSYRKTESEVSTGGLYGMIRSLKSYEYNFKPKQIYICFDKEEYTFRNEIYSEYKANRKEIDRELKNQFPMLKEYCKLTNIPFIEKDMYEADDIIGSLCCNADKYKLNPYAVTGDRDILQLIYLEIDVLYLSNNGPTIYGENQIRDEYNIEPNQFLDYKALVGDPSDNIPGVPGVGKKTAAKLLGLYGSLEKIYENTDEIKGKLKDKVIENKDMAYLFREISKIKCDLDLNYDKYFLQYIKEGYDLDNPKAIEFLNELEINID